MANIFFNLIIIKFSNYFLALLTRINHLMGDQYGRRNHVYASHKCWTKRGNYHFPTPFFTECMNALRKLGKFTLYILLYE